MLSLGKKVDYALVSLAYLVEHAGRITSARVIAQTHKLPLPALMNILKTLHQQGILCSERGVKGGYQICASLDNLSLYALVEALEEGEDRPATVVGRLSEQLSLRALQYKVLRFLKEVKVSDLVTPGRRIDVPLEFVAEKKCRCGKPYDAPQLVGATENEADASVHQQDNK